MTHPDSPPPSARQSAEKGCIACSGEAVARVVDGAFRKPVCAVHRRLYSERGYLIDALLPRAIRPEVMGDA